MSVWRSLRTGWLCHLSRSNVAITLFIDIDTRKWVNKHVRVVTIVVIMTTWRIATSRICNFVSAHSRSTRNGIIEWSYGRALSNCNGNGRSVILIIVDELRDFVWWTWNLIALFWYGRLSACFIHQMDIQYDGEIYLYWFRWCQIALLEMSIKMTVVQKSVIILSRSRNFLWVSIICSHSAIGKRSNTWFTFLNPYIFRHPRPETLDSVKFLNCMKRFKRWH